MDHSLPDDDVLYEAFVNRDSSYEGIFFTGVKTTGVFCRPTCTARKARRENVEFFASARDALLNGYRPCKLCSPLAYRGYVPDWLAPLLEEINENPTIRLKDNDLRERGLDPRRVSSWFKKQHGMTFQAYLRALRIGQAFGRIRVGEEITGTASPHKQVILTTRILTPLGPMLAGATAQGICLLEFVDRRMLETQVERLNKLMQAEFVPGFNPHLDKLHTQLGEYFQGKRQVFDLSLVLPGSAFQCQVWEGLQTIPYGTTRSYKEQATLIGHPDAVRAVAKANGDNRIAILIPCHRVIGSDGSLTGYGGGLWRKQYLLDLEAGNRNSNE